MSEHSCPRCGERGLPDRSRYCLRCGAELGLPEEGTRAPYTPEHLRREVLVHREAEGGERKDVTVLIADVAGSLAMARALDPEDVHGVMDGFFALALDAVHAQRGTVNQFRGDGFMALFGAPRAQGEDAARALRAALEIRKRSIAYAEQVEARYGSPFEVRIGISSGLVWVGAIGNQLRRDYTAEGPTVGLAARLEALASPGQILVDEETSRRCVGFGLLDLGTRAVRGLAEPVRIFELTGDEAPVDQSLSTERRRGLTPFVGRAAELARLREAIGPVAGLRCIELRGEAGIGKSRLVFEALRALPAPVVRFELVCREASTRRAYAPWLRLLERWPESLPGAARARALGRELEGRGEGAHSPEQVADALGRLFGELLETRTVVIALDDAHWVDPSSRLLIERLTRRPPPGAFSLVATVRDDQEGDWGAGAGVTRLHLAALPPTDAQRLARLAGAGLAADLAEFACLQGGGNPLFVQEVARALCDGTPGQREAARLEVSLARAAERIPSTLRGVIAARIDSLPEGAKGVLEVAAVLGEPFDAGLLGDVLPGTEVDATELLELLVARGLLRGEPPGDYDFCHGIVRAVAESQLVRERKRTLHWRVADILAKRPLAETADGASRIGHHYDQAGDGPAALQHLLRAGLAYADLRAFQEAISHLRRAYELVQSVEGDGGDLEGSVGLALASNLSALDRTGEAAAVLESLDAGKLGAEDRMRLAAVQVQTGWVQFSNANDLVRGRFLVERGLAALESLPRGDDARLLAWSYLTRMNLLDGRLESALDFARRAAEHATARADRVGLAAARYNESAVHCEAGRIAEARVAAEDARSLAEATDNEIVGAAAFGALARVQLHEGDAAAALDAAGRAEALASRCGQAGLRYLALVVSGHAHLQRGETRAARDRFDALEAIGPSWPSTWLHRARGALEAGDLRGASELASRASGPGVPAAIRARALALLGLATGLGDGVAEQADALLGDAVSLCDALGLRPGVAEAQLFLAELCVRRGDSRRAAHYRESAAAGFERCGMPWHAERARRLIAP